MAGREAAGLKWFVVAVIDSFMGMLLLLMHESFFVSPLAMEHSHSFRKLFKGLPTWRYFGRNLGNLSNDRFVSGRMEVSYQGNLTFRVNLVLICFYDNGSGSFNVLWWF